MLVSIHLVARLFRMPVLRIDGDIVLLDDDRLGHSVARNGSVQGRRHLTAGRLLALAEAELAAVDDRWQTSTSALPAPRRAHRGG